MVFPEACSWGGGDIVQKDGAILGCEKFSNGAPFFGRGHDGRHHIPLAQSCATESCAVPPQGIRRFCMTLHTVGESLTRFASSREFISAIADAMEAHDEAYFAAGILHCDVSVGNILFTDDRKGMLVDWDRCAEASSARRPSRMGTWQFMSAMLLYHPDRPRQIEDDRESAFHVLLWLALRYTESCVYETLLRNTVVPASLQPDTRLPPSHMVSLMRAYIEPYADGRGVIKRDILRKVFFISNLLSGLEFSGRPGLDALVEEFIAFFEVRHARGPTADDIKSLELLETLLVEHADDPNIHLISARDSLPAYRYPIRLGRLTARRWVVDTIRRHLETGDWPHDAATSHPVVPKMGCERKIRRPS